MDLAFLKSKSHTQGNVFTLAFSFPESILTLDFLTGNTSSIRVSMYLGFFEISGFLSPLSTSLVSLTGTSKFSMNYKPKKGPKKKQKTKNKTKQNKNKREVRKSILCCTNQRAWRFIYKVYNICLLQLLPLSCINQWMNHKYFCLYQIC